MNSGFTLIELMVVMFIITIMTAAFVLGAGQEEKKTALIRSARSLAQDLREIEEMVMSSRAVNCPSDPPTRLLGFYFKQVSVGDWGKTYTVFADCDQSKRYVAAQDVIIKEVTLEKGVRFYESIPPEGVSPAAFLNIVFEPPEPLVYINTRSALDVEASIKICLEPDCPADASAAKKIVKINTAGRIEIE